MDKAITISGELKGEGVGEWSEIDRRTGKLSALMGPHAASPTSPDAIIEAAVREVPEVQEAEKRMEAIKKEIESLELWFQRRLSDEEIQRKLKMPRLPTLEDLERRRRVLEEWEQELEKLKASLREEFKKRWGNAAEAIFRAIELKRGPRSEELEVHMIAPPEGMTWAQLLNLVGSNPESFSLRVWLVTPYGRTLEMKAVKQFAGVLTFTRSDEEGEYDAELNFKEPEEPAEPEKEPLEPERRGKGEADVTKIPPLPKIGRRRDDWKVWELAAKKLQVARALLERLWGKDPQEAAQVEDALGEIESQLFQEPEDVMSIIEQIEEITKEIKAKIGEEEGEEEEDVEESVEAPLSREEDIREKLGAYISALSDAGRQSEASKLAHRLRRTRTLEGLRRIYDEVIRQALKDEVLYQIATEAGLFDDEERIEEMEDDTERAAGGTLLRLVLLRKCSQFVSTYYRRRRQDVDTRLF